MIFELILINNVKLYTSISIENYFFVTEGNAK